VGKRGSRGEKGELEGSFLAQRRRKAISHSKKGLDRKRKRFAVLRDREMRDQRRKKTMIIIKRGSRKRATVL